MYKENMWNTALDIAHIEGKFEASGELIPIYIKKRLDTLYAALFVLAKQDKIDKNFEVLEKLLYDELIGNSKSNTINIYTNAITIIESSKREEDNKVYNVLEDARAEVRRRYSHKYKKEDVDA